MPKPGLTREHFKVSITDMDHVSHRVPVAVSLGCHVHGYLQPHVDPQHAPTGADGARKRVGPRLPPIDPKVMARFREFVKKTLPKLFPDVLGPDADVSTEHWLREAPYPAWRKEELRAAAQSLASEPINRKDYECKSFIKDEHYPEYKHARTINSRSDRFKVFSGPIFHQIEKVVFACKYFIKKIPASKRVQYIMEQVYLHGAMYVCSDYSSFEAAFSAALMEACEFQVYEYIAGHVQGFGEWYRIITEALAGHQTLKFKHFTAWTRATRMSGDMCTSLGNGVTNLLVALFVGEELQLGEMRGVFEGDDGLYCYQNGVPNKGFYEALGFSIKLETYSEIRLASFCGLVFVPETGTVCTDPSDVLSLIGWTSSRYYGSKRTKLLSLLRSKGLSLAYQYPGAPVVCRLAAYILRVTAGIDTRWLETSRNVSAWDRAMIVEAGHSAVCTTTDPLARLLVEEKWGWSVSKQLRVEAYLDGLDRVQPLNIELDNDTWAEYWRLYVVRQQKLRNEPTLPYLAAT